MIRLNATLYISNTFFDVEAFCTSIERKILNLNKFSLEKPTKLHICNILIHNPFNFYFAGYLQNRHFDSNTYPKIIRKLTYSD